MLDLNSFFVPGEEITLRFFLCQSSAKALQFHVVGQQFDHDDINHASDKVIHK